jgi:hypothetical protein
MSGIKTFDEDKHFSSLVFVAQLDIIESCVCY